MRRCLGCGRQLAADETDCPACGSRPTDLESLETRTNVDGGGGGDQASTPGATTSRPPSPSQPSALGITSAGGSGSGLDPGTIFAGRFRIIGLLGRGGMGEVYRADDLSLGQPVALKFLPLDLTGDAERLERFRAEVRVARQVSHPNICRVHDIGEAEGRVFLSMELVEGGDLASLLKRVGRLPKERGLEIARQLCAGLAAAHERGVLHRDLKPANVMIDAEGRVSITDFGLAGLRDRFVGREIRSGTPAYMAPEALSGEEVTERSDIFSLGLVLYELFTGRRVYAGKTLAEIRREHESGAVRSSMSQIEEIDPALERVILSCLETDPQDRPGSALRLAAALPGGDALAIVLAAGETPSPELVAAASASAGVLRTWQRAGLVATVLVSLLVHAALGGDEHVLSRTPMTRSPAVLLDRASEVLASLGYGEAPVDTAHGFGAATAVVESLTEGGLDESERRQLEIGEIEVVRFWLRTSPEPLVAARTGGVVTPSEPPRLEPGGLYAVFDVAGRLHRLEVVPEAVRSPSSPTMGPDVPWASAFAAADLERAAFDEAAALWTAPHPVDELRAWIEREPARADLRRRVEVGVRDGRVAYLRVSIPGEEDAAASPDGSQQSAFAAALNAVLFFLVLAGGAYLAWRNTRLGRVDRVGALRVAGLVLATGMAAQLLMAHHLADPADELTLLVELIGFQLFLAAAVWLLYMALEPSIRKRWPQRLIAWRRLLANRRRDPLVAGEALIGLALGCGLGAALTAFGRGVDALGLSSAHGLDLRGLGMLADSWQPVARLVGLVPGSIFSALFVTVLFLLVTLALRRTWLASIVAMLIIVAQNVLVSEEPAVAATAAAMAVAVVLFALLRYGLLALATTLVAIEMLQAFPLSVGAPGWTATATVLPLAVCLGLAALVAHRSGTAATEALSAS